jgi:ribosomal protein S18 acetylase RimI-like enzyme
MVEIRKAQEKDQDAIWEISREVIATGDTYTFSPDSTKEQMLAFWMGKDRHTYVAVDDEKVLGMFLIKDNQPGLGAHIANAAYMVSEKAEGKGIGKSMCLYSLDEAKRLGYLAMQFNIVIKSNERAVKLWQKLGFQIIGEIPEAFRHKQLGLTNAYIMYRKL